MKHHKVLTAQESSSLSLSMQGREELDEASPGFFSFDSLPPSPTLLPSFSTHAFFPSFSTQAFFSFFFLPLSIHQNNITINMSEKRRYKVGLVVNSLTKN